MEPENKCESILARLSQQLTLLERRDFEQWVIVVGTGILVGSGLVAILFPGAILREGTVHFEISVSRQLFIGLIALLALFNTYMITSRLKLRRTRGEIISTAIQSELLRLQSFTDPLTEVYNRRSLEDMLTKYTHRAERLNKPLSFLMVDVDSFRRINTRFGHTTGDFVLLGTEVNPVLQTLRANGIEITALHSHMLTEEPRLFFMHFWANDDAQKLAKGLRAALDKMNVAHS